jgi:acyl-CoA thioester hydrolase
MPYVTGYRIYYEDTDAGGVVYHANYLKFAERARTEWLRGMGLDQSELWEKQNIGFVIRRVEADFLAPARLDDMISIETCLHETGKVRMKIRQTIRRDVTVLARIAVIVACVGKNGRPVRLPPEIEKSGN